MKDKSLDLSIKKPTNKSKRKHSDASLPIKREATKKNSKPNISYKYFIKNAYAKKGRLLPSLKDKDLKYLTAQKRLTETERASILNENTSSDPTLAVLLQLLLSTHEINERFENVKDELLKYVEMGFKNHPLFLELKIMDMVMSNHNDLTELLELIINYDLSELKGIKSDKPLVKQDFELLKKNAIRCLVVSNVLRGKGQKPKLLSRVPGIFNKIFWSNEKSNLEEKKHLRVITMAKDFAALGVVTFKFQEKINTLSKSAQQAREALKLEHDKNIGFQSKIAKLESEIFEHRSEIENLNNTITSLNIKHQDTLVHTKDDFEKLRTRVLRRVRSETQLLSIGLTALRKTPPKTHVMDDHAERVLESLNEEIKKLKGDNV